MINFYLVKDFIHNETLMYRMLIYYLVSWDPSITKVAAVGSTRSVTSLTPLKIRPGPIFSTKSTTKRDVVFLTCTFLWLYKQIQRFRIDYTMVNNKKTSKTGSTHKTNSSVTYVAPPAISANKLLCGVVNSTMPCKAFSTSSRINPLLSPFLANRALAVISTS